MAGTLVKFQGFTDRAGITMDIYSALGCTTSSSSACATNSGQRKSLNFGFALCRNFKNSINVENGNLTEDNA